MLECAKGTITQRADVVVSRKAKQKKQITITLENINTFLGSSLSLSKCSNILKKLDCSVSALKKNTLKVVPPTSRSDLKQEVDLMEEIARIEGYNNLPMSLPQIKAANVSLLFQRQTRKSICDALIALGLREVVTYTMVGKDILEKTKSNFSSCMRVLNPLTCDQEYMRPTLLPSLLTVARSNLNKGQKNIKIFEQGKIYPKDGEKETLGIMMTGKASIDWRQGQKENEFEFYDIKGVVEELIGKTGIKDISFRAGQERFFENGQRADIFIKKNKIGFIGKLDEEILGVLGIKQNNILFAQLETEKILSTKTSAQRYEAVSEYPAVVRDISISVFKKVEFSRIKSIAEEIGSGLLSDIIFLEEYLGEKIPKDRRGVVFSLIYQLSSRTLTEEEVNKVHERICKTLVDTLGAEIR